MSPDTVSGLQTIEVSRIKPNKMNPRGPNVREMDPHRGYLKESIALFGVLVPLVVRPIDDGNYELIDGERRYWVARSLKIERVPAYVADGQLDSKAILQRMFQIHMNREQWDAVQQCKASEPLYAELLKKHRGDFVALVNEFAIFTGTDRRTARNRLQFLRWPKDIKKEIYEDPEKHDSYWYVVEIEDKIIEPAQRNYPEYFEKVSVDEVREFLYRKWDENTVGAAVEVRQAAVIARTQFKIKSQRKKAIKIFDRLVRDADLTYEEAFKEFAQEFPTLVEPKLPKPRSLINSVRNLADILSQYEPEFLEAYRKRKKPPLDEVVNAVRSLIAAAQGFLRRLKH